MTIHLFSCMRNEAAYALEWICYHRLIGFERITICSNDCADGTDTLLDALHRIGWVTHVRNPTPKGIAPQLHAAARIGEDPPWSDGDWVMWLDTDEFLNIQLGEGRVTDLIAKLGDADGYAGNWRLFGDGGETGWRDSPVIFRFQQAGKPRADLHEPVKTLFRWSPSVETLHSHRPLLRPSFRDQGKHWLYGPGTAVPEVFYYTRWNKDASPALRLPWVAGQFTWAQINHYAVRSWPEYRLKSTRGSGIFEERHTDEYWRLYNLNHAQDRTIQRHLPGVDTLIAEALSHPPVHHAHRDAMAAFRERLAGVSG